MTELSTCPPLTRTSITQAYGKIAKYIVRTEIITSELLDQLASSSQLNLLANTSRAQDVPEADIQPDAYPPPKFNLYFKCENYQRTGAFKARGAFHALSRLIEECGIDQIRRRGVTTASSGNHAQGLALAATTFDVPAFIVMPENSTKSKVEGVAKLLGLKDALGESVGKSSKGEIIFCGASNEDKKTAVSDVMRERNCLFVPPYDHPDIILGQGTCALELEQQFLELGFNSSKTHLDAVLAPIGGGGLLGGIATYFADTPATRVYGAEPSFQGADDARRGLLQNSRIEHVSSSTIADGLRTPVGEINWNIVQDKSKVEGIFAVSEDEIRAAMKAIYEKLGMLVEPSGCVPLAVVLFKKSFRDIVAKETSDRGGEAWQVAIVLSGGNTTMKV